MRCDRPIGRWTPVAIVVGVVVVAAASTLLAVGLPGTLRGTWTGPGRATCSLPSLPGTAVDVSLYDAGSTMMGRRTMMVGMGVEPERIPAGTVSFVVRNNGGFIHELTVLRLMSDRAGALPSGPEGTAPEGNALGHAEVECGTGEGAGIPPGGTGWLTLELAPGRYELICNEPDHYESGMYRVLTVA